MPPATYRIQAPNGVTYLIDGPEGASDDMIRAEVLRQHPEAKGAGPVSDNEDQAGRVAKRSSDAAAADAASPMGRLSDAMTGPLEAIGSVVRGAVAKPVSDVAGLAAYSVSAPLHAMGVDGGVLDRPQDVKEAVQRFVAGDGPQSKSGREIMGVVGKPGEWWDKGAKWLGEKAGSPESPDTPEDAPSRMVARAVRETINQVPAVLGAKLPEGAAALGGAMREGSISTMLKAIKPSVGDLKSGAARRAAITQVDEGINQTPGGMTKANDIVDGLNRDIAQTIHSSTGEVSTGIVPFRLKSIVDLYARKISESNAADRGAINDVWTSFLNNPLVNERTGPIAARLMAAEQRLQQLKAEHGAALDASSDLHAQGARIATESAPTNFHPVEGMPRVSERVAAMGGPDEFFPVPGMPRVPGRLSSAAEAGAENQGALDAARQTAGTRAQQIAAAQREVDDLGHMLDQLDGKITVQAAQEIKQDLYKQTYRVGAEGPAADAKKSIARVMREGVAEAEPSVGAMNAAESDMLNVLSVSEGRALKAATKNPFGLSLIAHSKLAFASFMLDRSPLFHSIVARILNRTGKVLEGTTEATTPLSGELISESADNPKPKARVGNTYDMAPATLKDLSTFKALPAP